ncbi:hypothetical protein LTR67_007379 [Exophiala xenobiotica]
MGDAGEIKQPQVELQTSEHEEVLNLIDTLRSHGISQYIDLPQLIVCGDQSSGKSSVLEAISGLRFPTKDNLCTRFATELILRRGPSTKVTITIHPDDERPEQESQKLSQFQSPSNSLDDFADIVKSAEQAMGLDSSAKVFSKDVLRVELCGPAQPNLTLVDLPGIFWAGDKSQSDDDAQLVQSMVKSYMEKSRSIILAVISAKSDLAMQVITKLAREIDPDGLRTLGIITKPDLLHEGSDSEANFVKLAKNENIAFKLGWHVLKNRDYDTKDTSSAERDDAERTFFSGRVWSSALPKSQVGVNNLRPRLSRVLLGQILAELPNLVRDVEDELRSCKNRLQALGGSRSTLLEQRTYLLAASQTFVDLMKDAVGGNYSDAFFGSSDSDAGYDKRLRAVAQCMLSDFADHMRLRGHAQKIVEESVAPPTLPNSPKNISRDKFLESVSLRMRRSRGCELPGLFNPAIVGDLFFEQSKPWGHILNDTEEKLVAAAKTAIAAVVEHACDSTTADAIMRHIVRPNMEPIVLKLHEKVEEVLRPHTRGHPITFNHYFIDNLQKMRQRESRGVMAGKIRQFFGADPDSEPKSNRLVKPQFDCRDLLNALLTETEADMELFACKEATNAMEAYYKVAMKSVIDSFGVYAIEECLLKELPNLFKPQNIMALEDGLVTRIAGESEESLIEREDLMKKLKVLEKTMTTLRRMKGFKGSGAIVENGSHHHHKDSRTNSSKANDSEANDSGESDDDSGDDSASTTYEYPDGPS